MASFIRALVTTEIADDVALLLDAGLPEPTDDFQGLRTFKVRRRYHGRTAAYEDAVALPRDLQHINPGVFHATTLRLPGPTQCRVAVALHDLIPWAVGGRAYLGERLRYGLARRLLRRADLVLAVSRASAEDAVRLAGVNPRRIEVVPEGVDEAFRRAPGAQGRVAERWGLATPYVLYVGALDPRKDPGALVELSRSLNSRGGPELVIAGDTGVHDKGAVAARRLGWMPDAELADLYAAAACLAFPSRYEGFGLPVVEAMACGCPVVAYRNSSLPEVAEDVALLVADGDRGAFIDAVLTVLRDEALARRLRAAGPARARDFTWQKAVRKTIAGYRRLLR